MGSMFGTVLGAVDGFPAHSRDRQCPSEGDLETKGWLGWASSSLRHTGVIRERERSC